jgi:hypothetical protein
MMLWDFAAVSHSISHELLFICLIGAQVPIELFDFVRALYSCNSVHYRQDGTIIHVYNAETGVLQITLSSTLFIIAMNVSLNLLCSLNLCNMTIRVAADDLAAVIPNLSILLTLFIAVEEWLLDSGLEINPPKCVIVPLGRRFTFPSNREQCVSR